MDFFTVGIREGKKGEPMEIFPDFVIGRSEDLMVRGKHFYAVWDEEAGLWSKDEYKVQQLVDAELKKFAEQAKAESDMEYRVKYLRNATNGGWYAFRKFMQNVSDNSHELDSELTFANTEVKKSDYVSRRLPYPLAPGEHKAWDELMGTLYSPEERAKLEWSVGAIVAGDAKKIQKFVVLYGPGGTGKSTFMNIVEALFPGYVTSFEAKALTSNNAAFATEAFRDNPLVAIQQDGDLSKMEDNSKFNSIISHEEISMNEKYKPTYRGKVNAFLYMGTNQPVKISDAKSGIIRRLIDVHPTGKKLAPNHYHTLVSQIDFELGAIAHHCLEVYRAMGRNFYNSYQPLEMMFQTDVFFNFIEANYDIFAAQNGATVKQAYTLYKEYCADSGIERPMPMHKVRGELQNYFDEFKERHVLSDGSQVRSYYHGFNANKFKTPVKDDGKTFSLVMEEETSLFDLEFAEMPAQLARKNEFDNWVPSQRWINVKTSLADIDTHELHYVKVPDQHIVIDFDLKDDSGNKSLEKNLAAASLWPATYAELSQGGNGVHLHYEYEGDVTELAAVYDEEGIEVKSLLGDASLRRRLSKCNNVPVMTMSAGYLPVKEKKPMQDQKTLQSEKGVRNLIERALQKEFNAGTKPSVDFIAKILEDAYDSGMPYDVTDLRPRIIAFANSATNQALPALKVVQQMKWKAADATVSHEVSVPTDVKDERLAFYDVEVYPNLFIVCWKFEGAPKESTVVMVNPTPQEIEGLFKLKLVGYFNRQYDNHILYARYLGFDNEALYKLSQKLISGSVGAKFGEAYGLSYTDILDYSSKKQSLKKFQIELGLPHVEMDIPWDEPVHESQIPKIIDYCINDVCSTEDVHVSRKADWTARLMLAELSGLTPNDTTQKHTARIIFGNDRNPQASFIYTELSKEFPGYTFDPFRMPKSDYMGIDPSEGGYVHAKPGIYEDVKLLDVASMHPTSIINLNLFGDYTPKFADLLNARLAIKAKDYSAARKMLDGKLAPFLEDESQAKKLSYALKIVINIVYGLTSARFDNAFRDQRNVDNIVAKRGALFMIALQKMCEDRGMNVVHIKTDSIKIAGATEEDMEFVYKVGVDYGYVFEHEATYEKMALVNDAVYVAKYGWAAEEELIGTWSATGAQFQHPYVFKKLFSHDKLEWDDFCETKQVMKGAIYLDPNPSSTEEKAAKEMEFIGRIGRFVPVTPETGGKVLCKIVDGKVHAVSGAKGFFWLEAGVAKNMGGDVQLDEAYFEGLLSTAYKTLEKFGDVEAFIA